MSRGKGAATRHNHSPNSPHKDNPRQESFRCVVGILSKERTAAHWQTDSLNKKKMLLISEITQAI